MIMLTYITQTLHLHNPNPVNTEHVVTLQENMLTCITQTP